jgi:hypothetical protein
MVLIFNWAFDLSTQASKAKLKINLFHPGPPEMEAMDWNLYDAGSIGVFSDKRSFPWNI